MRSLKRHPSSGPGAGGSRSERFVLFTVVLVSIFLVGVFWELERKNSSFRYDWGLLKAGKQQECNCAKEVQRDATLEYPKSAVFPPGGSSSPLPAWKPSVPAAVLRRGVAYAGDLLRMDQLLSKVVEQRKALTVVSIGSSCTSEFGGRRGPQLKLLNLDPFEVSRVVHPDGWLSAALDHLVELFPPRQPKRWDVGADGAPEEQPYWLINLGIGAVGPEPWLECLGCCSSSSSSWPPSSCSTCCCYCSICCSSSSSPPYKPPRPVASAAAAAALAAAHIGSPGLRSALLCSFIPLYFLSSLLAP